MSIFFEELLCHVPALQSCGGESTVLGPSRLLWTSMPVQTARSTCSRGEQTICLHLPTTKSLASWRWRRGFSWSRTRTGWGTPTCWSGTWRTGTASTNWRFSTDARSESQSLLSDPSVIKMPWMPHLRLVFNRCPIWSGSTTSCRSRTSLR